MGKTWACPFFGWDEKRKVHCEGGGAGFKDRDTFLSYTSRYCASVPGWKNCSLAVALLEYYEKGDQDDDEKRQDQKASV